MPQVENTGIQKVKTATGKTSKKSFYHRNLSTSGFMQVQPMFYHECVPYEKIDGRYQIWSRLNPLVTPCMGIINYHYSKFFVRFKDVWLGWDDFYNRALSESTQSGNGVDPRVWLPYSPYFTMLHLFQIFENNKWITTVTPPVTAADPLDYCDIIIKHGSLVNPSYSNQAFNFTPYGALVVKALESLGYELSWNMDDITKYSALPIICFGKVFTDHYWPKAYKNRQGFAKIRRLFFTNIVNVGTQYDSSTATGNYMYEGLEAILQYCFLAFYDNNGFYQAWDNPFGPNEQQSAPSFTDYYGTTGDQFNNDEPTLIDTNASHNLNTPIIYGSVDYISGLSKFALNALGRLSDMMKRYQLSGYTWIDHFLARFGYKPQDTHTAIRLGTDVVEVRVGDVESTGNTQVTVGSDQFTSVLGSLSGKGVGARTGQVKWTNGSDAGMFIGFFSVIPDGDLYQGIDPMNLHVEPDQFYSPEIDSLGPAAVPSTAILVTRNGVKNSMDAASDPPFGFMPQQYEYCMSRSILSGAFKNTSQGRKELSAYHLYRDLYNQGMTSAYINHSFDFMRGTDAEQYNRVFYNNQLWEQFIVRFRAEFDSWSTKRSLTDSYDWENTDGKDVVVDGNSVEMN